MDGHECSELLLSELENCRTLGAEYYSKEFVSIVDKVKAIPHTTLSNASELITDGDHGSPDYQEEGVLYLLSECIKPGYIDLSKSRFITDAKHKELKRSSLHPGNVVVTKTGVNFGISAVIPDDYKECNTIAHVGKIALKSEYNPYVLSSFLNSKYGYYQMRRRGLKATRPEMKLVEMQDIIVPIFETNILADKIKETIDKGYSMLSSAEKAYEEAEELLDIEIGIDIKSLGSGGFATKSFSESFISTGRFDAEYYQPKFDTLVSAIRSVPHKKLCNIVNVSKSIEPGSKAYRDEGIPFIRISDVSKYEISEPDKYLEVNGDFDLADYYLRKDEILFSKDGSVGIAYKVEDNSRKITSSALLHLKVKDLDEIMPDYLTTVLNSNIVQMQAERDAGGSIIKHWRPDQIEEILIPILDKRKQHEVALKAAKSFELRYKAKELLSCAKTAIEIAIEKNETSAILWLETRITELTKE